jgi:predicted nucleic acid-binding protein
LLNRCRLFPVRPLFDYEAAARIYQRCRQSGITPRSLSDCLVATVAIGNDAQLLHAGADFDRMAPVIGLQLA